MTRLIDVDNLLKELEDWEADLYEGSKGRKLGVTDAIVIACQMPTVDKIEGYKISELIWFATACRRAEIEEEDLKAFCGNVSYIYEFVYETVLEEFNKQVKECMQKERLSN